MSRRRPARIHGLLAVAKTAGPTSHDVVDMARRALRERRVGHTGTLDPMAEGLLLLCVGQATRLQRYLLQWDKVYHGVIRLGRATTTYDREGETVEPSGPPPALDADRIEALARRFQGTIEQVPPPYSAKKVDGRKLYELARDGQDVRLEPKTVTVQRLQLTPAGPDRLEIELCCSTGFYVRSLAHDIGIELGCGAHLEHLERRSIGPYAASEALPQAELEAGRDPGALLVHPAWIPIERISMPFPSVSLNPGAAERFVHGQEVILLRSGGEPLAAESPVRIHGPGDELLGVGTVSAVLARGRTVSIRPTVVLSVPKVPVAPTDE